VDASVCERCGQRVVDPPVLVDQREALERGRRDHDLEVVAAPGAVRDLQLGRVRKRLLEKLGDGYAEERTEETVALA